MISKDNNTPSFPPNIVEALKQEQTDFFSNDLTPEDKALLQNDPLLIDLSKNYPLPEYTLSYNGVGVMPLNNISLVKGKQKQGKTFVFSVLIAQLLGCNSFSMAPLLKKANILYFDTEQDQSDTAEVARRDHRLLGWQDDRNHDGLRCFYMRELDTDKRLPEIVRRIKVYKPNIVFIDGAVDLGDDFNDLKESKHLVSTLLKLSSRYHCHICVVLHTNKGKEDNNSRGHLGTILEQKCSDVFLVEKDKEKINVTETEVRGHRNIDDFAFSIAPDGMPYKTTTSKEAKDQSKRDDVSRIMKAVFGSDLVLGANEIGRRYVEYVANDQSLSNITEQTVTRYRIPFAISHDIIEKTSSGRYRRVV